MARSPKVPLQKALTRYATSIEGDKVKIYL